MEKPINQVEQIIKSLYKKVGGDSDLITRIWMEGDNYKVQKRGGKEVIVACEWIEDYIESNDSASESKIKYALKQLIIA